MEGRPALRRSPPVVLRRPAFALAFGQASRASRRRISDNTSPEDGLGDSHGVIPFPSPGPGGDYPIRVGVQTTAFSLAPFGLGISNVSGNVKSIGVEIL